MCTYAGRDAPARAARGDPVGRRVRRLQGACRTTTLSRVDGLASDGRLVAVAIVVGVVALDQLTKVWAVARLDDGPISIVGTRRRAPAEPQHRRRVQPLPGVHAAPRGARRSCSPCSSCAPCAAPTTCWMVVALALVLGGATRQPDRPYGPGTRGSSAARSSTSSASARCPTFNVADSRDHDRRDPARGARAVRCVARTRTPSPSSTLMPRRD